MSASELYVAGTRSFSAEVADFAEEAGFRVAGLLEPYDRERVGSIIHGFPVTWLEDAVPGRFVVGTGEPARREIVARLAACGWEAATLVHPRAHVSSRASIGAGSVVGPGVVVGACARVAEHVVLGRGTLVGHHTEIGPFVTLGPGANVAGNVRVGPDVFLGMGAVVRDHVVVGAGSVVAMGAVVVGDVAPGARVRGVPAVEERGVAPPDPVLGRPAHKVDAAPA